MSHMCVAWWLSRRLLAKGICSRVPTRAAVNYSFGMSRWLTSSPLQLLFGTHSVSLLHAPNLLTWTQHSKDCSVRVIIFKWERISNLNNLNIRIDSENRVLCKKINFETQAYKLVMRKCSQIKAKCYDSMLWNCAPEVKPFLVSQIFLFIQWHCVRGIYCIYVRKPVLNVSYKLHFLSNKTWFLCLKNEIITY